MNEPTTCENYLHDLGFLIREMALEAKSKSAISRSDFDFGYLAAFHRVVSLMQQQADAFGLPVEIMRLENLDPDEELI